MRSRRAARQGIRRAHEHGASRVPPSSERPLSFVEPRAFDPIDASGSAEATVGAQAQRARRRSLRGPAVRSLCGMGANSSRWAHALLLLLGPVLSLANFPSGSSDTRHPYLVGFHSLDFASSPILPSLPHSTPLFRSLIQPQPTQSHGVFLTPQTQHLRHNGERSLTPISE